MILMEHLEMLGRGSNFLRINYLQPIVLTIGCLFFCTINTFTQTTYPGQGGQITPDRQFGGATQPTGIDTDSTQSDVEIDTANIVSFYPDKPAVTYPENDSLLNNYFHQYDPTRHRALDYFDLGMPSTAAYSAVYQSSVHRGLDMGLHAFDVYQIKNSDIRFYQQTKSFTDVYYSSASQTNGSFDAKFSRNFANDVHLSIDYKRLWNTNLTTLPQVKKGLFNGTGLTYDAPRGRAVAFGIGLWVHREQYDGYFTFTSNISNEKDQGGILDDAILKNTEGGTLTTVVPTPLLTNAVTRYEKYEYSYLHYLKLRKDSTGTKRNFLASHQITFRSATYRASDPFSNSQPLPIDSFFYGTLLNDARGLRFALKEKMLENTFNLSTGSLRAIDTAKAKKGTTQNDWFEVGITHQFNNVNQELGGRNFNNILLRGRWNFTPSDNLKVETYAHFNLLGHNVGDYRLSGELFYNVKNIGSLTVKGVNQLYEPSMIQESLVLTQRSAWENTFKKTLETSISGTLSVPKVGFEGTFAYNLLNNYIYFDKTFMPQQASTPLSIVQLILTENAKFGNFHLDNTLAFQKPTEKFVRLPDLYTKNSFYVEGKIFKQAMLARVGFDLRYATAWFAPGFMPLTGQFYVQEKEKVAAHPSLDAFLSFKVQSFRFFVKMENLLGAYTGSRYYQIYNYPVPEGSFRFGVRWRLLN
jgi:Putative porin